MLPKLSHHKNAVQFHYWTITNLILLNNSNCTHCMKLYTSECALCHFSTWLQLKVFSINLVLTAISIQFICSHNVPSTALKHNHTGRLKLIGIQLITPNMLPLIVGLYLIQLDFILFPMAYRQFLLAHGCVVLLSNILLLLLLLSMST